MSTSKLEEMFNDWWSSEGIGIDPDPDVNWYDKRRGLAQAAFFDAMRISRNHTADEVEEPDVVWFKNGCTVATSEYGHLVVTKTDIENCVRNKQQISDQSEST